MAPLTLMLSSFGSSRTFALATVAVIAHLGPANRASAADEWSANATIASEYVFRGISQTDRRFAFQGGVDWTRDGVFAGAWASNVDFAAAEVDLYAGYATSLAGVTATASFRAYLYPESQDLPGSRFDYFEIGGSINYSIKGVTLGSSFSYSPDFFEQTGDAYYTAQTASFDIGGGFSISSELGRQWVEDNFKLRKPDYWHWAASLVFAQGPLTFSATYSDTDVVQNDCLSGATICAARAFGAVTLSF